MTMLILKQFEPDREVVIHTLKGENVDITHIVGIGNVNFFTYQTGL